MTSPLDNNSTIPWLGRSRVIAALPMENGSRRLIGTKWVMRVLDAHVTEDTRRL